jgi:hypothetical protein
MKRLTLLKSPLLYGAACCSAILLMASVIAVKRARAVNPPAATVAVAQGQLGADVLTKGNWSGGLIAMKDVPIHISVLPDGRLLYWARDKADLVNNDNGQPGPDTIPDWDEQDKSKTHLWDPLYADFGSNPPSTPALAPPFNFTVENTETNLFCSGHSFLQDGTLLVAGGHRRHPDFPDAEGVGDVDLNLFDYRTNSWSLLRNAANNPIRMPKGRWYPYNLTLANGETIIISGSFVTGTSGNLNKTPDILGLDGSLRSGPSDQFVSFSNVLAIYPRIFLAPDGRVFYSGAPNDSFTRFLNLQINQWQDTGDGLSNHDVGSGILYAPGQVMMAGGRGGTGPANNAVELYNTNLSNPAWLATSPMNHARAQMSALTLLPDGKVLAVGGTRCPGTNDVEFDLGGPNQCSQGQVRTPELWNPTTSSWTRMADHQETRVYHSTSILLPDARVLVAGGGLPLAAGEFESGFFCYGETRNTFRCRNNGHRNAEIFEPPYLFESDGQGAARRALRPGIIGAPESMTYGNQFSVEVGNVPASEIAKVVLIRLPSVTHGFDQDQRRVVLQSQVSGTRMLLVTAPADGKECPPGPYMMFLIRNNQRETPSLAKIVRVGSLSLSRNFHIFLPGSVADVWNGTQVEVKAQSGVSWQAVVSPAEATSWLSLETVSGTGNGTIIFSAMMNRKEARSAKIIVRIPGQKFTSHELAVYQAGNFNDTTQHPLSDYIRRTSAYGVIAGCGNGNFCPNGLVSRGAMALFLMKSIAVPDSRLPAPNTPRYADVGATHGLYRFVEGAATRGLDDSGCGGGNFCPDAAITRAQAAILIIRALGVTNPPPVGEGHFKDVPPGHPAYSFVEELARRGVTGCSPVAFCPNGLLTRSEMAFFVAQARAL